MACCWGCGKPHHADCAGGKHWGVGPRHCQVCAARFKQEGITEVTMDRELMHAVVMGSPRAGPDDILAGKVAK